MLVLFADLSSQSPSQQSGFFGVCASPGVSRHTGPMFISMMRPVCGLKPMLNSPWLLSADEPDGATKF